MYGFFLEAWQGLFKSLLFFFYVEGCAVLRVEFDMCSVIFFSFLGSSVQERVP